jgi:hypothetical protein
MNIDYPPAQVVNITYKKAPIAGIALTPQKLPYQEED